MYPAQSFAKSTQKFPCTLHNPLLKEHGHFLTQTFAKCTSVEIFMYFQQSFAKGAWKFPCNGNVKAKMN